MIVAPGTSATSTDPCFNSLKTPVNISTATGETQLVSAVSGKKVYICSVALVVPSAVAISFTEGTGSVCATSHTAFWGSTTAANGMSFAANGGQTFGSGNGTVAQTLTAGDALCILQSGTAQLAGIAMVVQQ